MNDFYIKLKNKFKEISFKKISKNNNTNNIKCKNNYYKKINNKLKLKIDNLLSEISKLKSDKLIDNFNILKELNLNNELNSSILLKLDDINNNLNYNDKFINQLNSNSKLNIINKNYCFTNNLNIFKEINNECNDIVLNDNINNININTNNNYQNIINNFVNNINNIYNKNINDNTIIKSDINNYNKELKYKLNTINEYINLTNKYNLLDIDYNKLNNNYKDNINILENKYILKFNKIIEKLNIILFENKKLKKIVDNRDIINYDTFSETNLNEEDKILYNNIKSFTSSFILNINDLSENKDNNNLSRQDIKYIDYLNNEISHLNKIIYEKELQNNNLISINNKNLDKIEVLESLNNKLKTKNDENNFTINNLKIDKQKYKDMIIELKNIIFNYNNKLNKKLEVKNIDIKFNNYNIENNNIINNILVNNKEINIKNELSLNIDLPALNIENYNNLNEQKEYIDGNNNDDLKYIRMNDIYEGYPFKEILNIKYKNIIKNNEKVYNDLHDKYINTIKESNSKYTELEISLNKKINDLNYLLSQEKINNNNLLIENINLKNENTNLISEINNSKNNGYEKQELIQLNRKINNYIYKLLSQKINNNKLLIYNIINDFTKNNIINKLSEINENNNINIKYIEEYFVELHNKINNQILLLNKTSQKDIINKFKSYFNIKLKQTINKINNNNLYKNATADKLNNLETELNNKNSIINQLTNKNNEVMIILKQNKKEIETLSLNNNDKNEKIKELKSKILLLKERIDEISNSNKYLNNTNNENYDELYSILSNVRDYLKIIEDK